MDKGLREILTAKELALLEQFRAFLDTNIDRKAVKITIEFQHKKFKDNKGFAVLDIPISSGWVTMKILLDAIDDETDEILNYNK